ncbi:MAG: hypothetical protein V1752_04180 [Candidatus Firestonebacteria bacterium]
MDEETVLKCEAFYIYNDKANKIKKDGPASILVRKESLVISPKTSELLEFSFREINNVTFKDYLVKLELSTSEEVEIKELGYKYEDFARLFFHAYNEMIMKDLLMKEGLKLSGIEAELTYGKENIKDECEVRIYDTALVVIPSKYGLLRVPFAEITGIKEGAHSVTVETEYAGALFFEKLARKHDSFVEKLSEVLNQLSMDVQDSLRKMAPSLSSPVIRQAARHMKDGRAVRRAVIEKAAPGLFEAVEKAIAETEMKAEYEYLKKLSDSADMCLGVKKELVGTMANEEGLYFWFLIPIGNNVAMEAIISGGDEKGKATYFFKMKGPAEKDMESFLEKMNRCMLAINFRREPIYLTDENLEKPEYQRYKYAIAKIPGLRDLRSAFLGRVVHKDDEQWQKDVRVLLQLK